MITPEKLSVFYEAKVPWLYVVTCSVSAIREFGWSLANTSDQVVVRFLRGTKMLDLDSLFNEFAAALQFPDYFGENWPAFHECLTDLSWLPGAAYILIIDDSQKVLSKEEAELVTLVKVLQRAGDEWSEPVDTPEAARRGSVPFHIIFQCRESGLKSVRSRLTTAGAFFCEIAL